MPLIVVALAGGIIWYNSLKTAELMVAAAERQMIETAEKISERIGLLYDPLCAIVAIASQVPEMKAPLHDDGHTGRPMLLLALRFYRFIRRSCRSTSASTTAIFSW